MSSPDLGAWFARITPLAGRRPAEFDITPLPGLTNRNYRLRAADADWVLRLPRPGTDRFIDRDAERHNQRAAAALGLTSLWAWRDHGGVTLTPALAGRSPRPGDFDDSALIDRVAALLRRLHASGADFRGRVEPGEAIACYSELLPADRRREFSARLRQSRRWLAQAAADERPAVPSHNDLVLDNLLLDDDRIHLIDWEFSAMASPYWDLATIANAAALGPAGRRRLLQRYCAGERQMEESVFSAYRKLLALLADCWLAALIET